MQERKTNLMARVVALSALLLALVLVVATIATTGGDSGDDEGDGGNSSEQLSGTTKKGERALDRGVWIVEDGDTLVAISEATGIDLDELVELNPDIDPQALISGQRISLRAGGTGEDSTQTQTDSGGDPADEFGDGSVDDGSSSSDGN